MYQNEQKIYIFGAGSQATDARNSLDWGSVLAFSVYNGMIVCKELLKGSSVWARSSGLARLLVEDFGGTGLCGKFLQSMSALGQVF